MQILLTLIRKRVLMAPSDPRKSTASAEDGIRVRVMEQLAREVGVDAQVIDVLWRLHRLHIVHDPGDGSLIVADLGKLHEYLELVEMPQKFEEAQA